MRGTVKRFHRNKGWGFVIEPTTWTDYFVHHSNINMSGYRTLYEGDIVNFEIGAGNDGRTQAVNITPILTRKMVERVLKKENLYLQTMKDTYGVTKYLVVDGDKVLRSREEGMSLLKTAKWAEMDTDDLEE